jgi:hypothetical protein
MTKLSLALNVNDSIRIKDFEIGNQKFQVKVPLSHELDEMMKRIADAPPKVVKERLKKMTAALTAEKIEGVEVVEDDVVVDGKSTKDTIVSIVQMENKITEYIKLLVPKEGSLENLTYQEIDEEFTLQTQLEIVEKITEVIQPGYKETRKN